VARGVSAATIARVQVIGWCLFLTRIRFPGDELLQATCGGPEEIINDETPQNFSSFHSTGDKMAQTQSPVSMEDILRRRQEEAFKLRNYALHKIDKAPFAWCHIRY